VVSDDIVSRIRAQANAGYIDEHEVMLREAADEIERLSEVIRRMSFYVQESGDWDSMTNHEIAQHFYEVVARGE